MKSTEYTQLINQNILNLPKATGIDTMGRDIPILTGIYDFIIYKNDNNIYLYKLNSTVEATGHSSLVTNDNYIQYNNQRHFIQMTHLATMLI